MGNFLSKTSLRKYCNILVTTQDALKNPVSSFLRGYPFNKTVIPCHRLCFHQAVIIQLLSFLPNSHFQLLFLLSKSPSTHHVALWQLRAQNQAQHYHSCRRFLQLKLHFTDQNHHDSVSHYQYLLTLQFSLPL